MMDPVPAYSTHGQVVGEGTSRTDLFPTPLFQFFQLLPAKTNAFHATEALNWQKEKRGIRLSNRGAYQSRHTLFEDPRNPETEELRRAILKAYGKVRSELYGLSSEPSPSSISIEGWYNVNRAGDFFVSHNHLGKAWHWSGTYYVRTGSLQNNEGQLVFENKTSHYDLGPKPISRIAHSAGIPASETAITPKENSLVLFPSSVMHRVAKFSSDGERISIAINIRDPELTWDFPAANPKGAGFKEYLRHYCLALYLPLKWIRNRFPT